MDDGSNGRRRMRQQRSSHQQQHGQDEQHGQLWWLWQRRSPRDRSQPIGVILGGLTGAIWFKQQKHLGKIVQVLRESLSSELGNHLAVVGFRSNTLHLRVDSATHRYELEARKELLLRTLNQQVSGLFVRDIKLSLGRLEEPWSAARRASPPAETAD